MDVGSSAGSTINESISRLLVWFRGASPQHTPIINIEVGHKSHKNFACLDLRLSITTKLCRSSLSRLLGGECGRSSLPKAREQAEKRAVDGVEHNEEKKNVEETEEVERIQAQVALSRSRSISLFVVDDFERLIKRKEAPQTRHTVNWG